MSHNLRLIAKLDIKNYNLVKGIGLEGLRVLGDPKKFIDIYSKEGADEIIYHDVVASLYDRTQMLNLVKRTSNDIFLPITTGGGIKTTKDVRDFLNSGADRIFVNSAFIRNKKFINKVVKSFGSSTVVCSIETQRIHEDYFCFIDFGREETRIKFEDWILYAQDCGVGEFLITSIDSDGKGKGFDLFLADKISKKVKIPFIVNGGFGQLVHFKEVLDVCNPNGIALGSMLHYKYLNSSNIIGEGNNYFLKNRKDFMNFGNFSIKQIKEFLSKISNIRQ
jgi:cyclase